MNHDYDSIIATHKETYQQLAQRATPGSIEENSYRHVVDWITRTVEQYHADAPSQRGFMVAVALKSLRNAFSEPAARSILQQSSRDYNRAAGFDL